MKKIQQLMLCVISQQSVKGFPEKTWLFKPEFLELQSKEANNRETISVNKGWIFKDEFVRIRNTIDGTDTKLLGKCNSDQSCVALTSCRNECENIKKRLIQTDTEVNKTG